MPHSDNKNSPTINTETQHPCPSHDCCPQIQRARCFESMASDAHLPAPCRHYTAAVTGSHATAVGSAPAPEPASTTGDTRNTAGTQHTAQCRFSCRHQTLGVGACTCPHHVPARSRQHMTLRPELLLQSAAHGARLRSRRGIHAFRLHTCSGRQH